MNFNLVAMKDYIDSNQEGLERLLRAVDAATEFIRDNERAAREILVNGVGFERELVDAQ